MSQSKSVTIDHNLGLHLRAAGALVQLASRYRSNLSIRYGGITANGKSIMSVLACEKPETRARRAELRWVQTRTKQQSVTRTRRVTGAPFRTLIKL